MGKTPTRLHGHERSRHHNYSRNSQARNRSSDNQGFAPANYIYPPERIRRQGPSSFGNLRYSTRPTLESGQHYRRGKSFRSRTFSSAYGCSQLPLKRLPQKRERTRQNMHSVAEKDQVSKNSQQSGKSEEAENGADSGQKEVKIQQESTEEVRSSVHLTRSTVKAQQNKSDDSYVTEKCEVDSVEGAIVHNTRSSSKTQNEENTSTAVSEVLPPEEKASIQSKKSASKGRVEDGNDEKEEEESTAHISRTRKTKKEVKPLDTESVSGADVSEKEESGAATAGGKENGDKTLDDKNEPEVESSDMNEQSGEDNKSMEGTGQKLQESPSRNEPHTTVLSQDTKQGAGQNLQESPSRNESHTTVLSQDTKQLPGNKSLRPLVSELELSRGKPTEQSPVKSIQSSEFTDMKDAPRRSSRKSSSKYKIEESQVSPSAGPSSSKTPVKPLHDDKIGEEKSSTSIASIRSISCRRPLRDTSSISFRDSPRHQFMHKQLFTSSSKSKEEVSYSNDFEGTVDEKSMAANDEPEEMSDVSDNSGKRKAAFETSQSHKKICTQKSVQNASSFFSVMSSPFQLSNKEEPVSSSTPVKILECSKEMIDIEITEEKGLEESVPFEKVALIPQNESEQTSRKWCSLM